MSESLPHLIATCNYSGPPGMGRGTTASLVPAGRRLDFVQEAGEYRQRVPLRAAYWKGCPPWRDAELHPALRSALPSTSELRRTSWSST